MGMKGAVFQPIPKVAVFQPSESQSARSPGNVSPGPSPDFNDGAVRPDDLPSGRTPSKTYARGCAIFRLPKASEPEDQSRAAASNSKGPEQVSSADENPATLPKLSSAQNTKSGLCRVGEPLIDTGTSELHAAASMSEKSCNEKTTLQHPERPANSPILGLWPLHNRFMGSPSFHSRQRKILPEDICQEMSAIEDSAEKCSNAFSSQSTESTRSRSRASDDFQSPVPIMSSIVDKSRDKISHSEYPQRPGSAWLAFPQPQRPSTSMGEAVRPSTSMGEAREHTNTGRPSTSMGEARVRINRSPTRVQRRESASNSDAPKKRWSKVQNVARTSVRTSLRLMQQRKSRSSMEFREGPTEEEMPQPSATIERKTSYVCEVLHSGKEMVHCVRFSPDSRYIAATFGNGVFCIGAADTGEQIVYHENDKSLPTMVRWRPQRSNYDSLSNQILTVSSEGLITQFNALSKTKRFTINEPDNQLLCVEYRSDGFQFATAGKKTEIHIYDEARQAQIQVLRDGQYKQAQGHSNRIFSLKYHPQDPCVLVSGSWDRMLQIWDTRSGRLAVRSILGPYVCGDSVDFSSNGSTLLTGSARMNKQVELWDFGSGKLTQTVPWDSAAQCSVMAARFCGNNTIVAGGSSTSEVKLFDGACKWKSFGNIDLGPGAECFAVDFSPDGSLVAVGSSDATIRVFRLH